MNRFPFRLGCDVCGGEGVGSAATNAAAWNVHGFVAHADPRVCQAVLAAARREAEKYPPIHWRAP